MKSTVSIIFVYYNTPSEIVDAVRSIPNSIVNVRYEIIIVDNASSKQIPSIIIKNKNVKIIKNGQNYGYGKALNQGVKRALGKYILLVNSDIQFNKNAIKNMIDRSERDDKVGVVGPMVLDKNGKMLQSISDMPLLPRALVIFSFLKNFFPFNHIYKKYHNYDLNRNREQAVDVVGGVCMIARKSVFEKAGGFDERFFMYFEEADFCYRVKQLGYKVLFYPNAKIVHLGSRSMQDKEWIEKTFEKSRFLFFHKYQGIINALIAEALLRSMKSHYFLLILILGLSLFLSLYRINELMPFIGDQGWFYLSAKDMVINGEIPLVGISSSHPWLHQGPLWTYMLAGTFWLFGFNPLNGAYLTITLGILSIVVVYIVGSQMFSKRIGLISSLLYATSPLVIIYVRTPYHTSPIPLFTLFYIFSLYKFIKGNSNFFPLSILFLSILYNLELATAILWFILFIILTYGVWKKTEWVKKIFSRKILIYSILAFVVPMIPILIYDFYNNFPQTIKFVAWIGYRILKFFGFPSIHGEVDLINFNSMIMFSFHFYQYLIFAASSITAFVILVLSFGALFINIYHQFRKKIYQLGFILLFLWILIFILGYFMNKTSSEAYLPIIFPALIYLVAFPFDKIMKEKIFFIPAVLLVIFFAFINSYFIISKEYFTNNRSNLTKRLSIAREIIKKSKGREYNLVGAGNGSQFASFTMNYKYLLWWFGKGESEKKESLRFIIEETSSGIIITKHEAISK